MPTDQKRVFFGFEIDSPWPQTFPTGRLLQEKQRHLTLAFLGNVHFNSLLSILEKLPKPTFKIGLVGEFDRCLFLPHEPKAHVAAWHTKWLEAAEELLVFRQLLIDQLIQKGFIPFDSEKEFLPHVTICRKPFDKEEWKQAFQRLPFITKNFHLYESLGHSQYQPIWSYPILSPIEEIEHTADVAFLIRGKDFEQLHRHAQIALAFQQPSLLDYFSPFQPGMNLDDIIIDLNEMIAKADTKIGCSFKAISFHDRLKEEQPNVLKWEMIIDV